MLSRGSGIRSIETDILKPAQDKREYAGLELDNGLKVLLISDPSTDKSAAAMDVHVGSMCDPPELPGLAHFCEHMLFLGTEKYPQENEYSKFLIEHGGASNAFTSAEHTNYYFDVAPEHISGALDRFAQFFHSPLFTASATDREVNAVNSENDKNIQNDTWRLHQLEKSTSKPGHDFNKFSTGNKLTLDTIPKEQGIIVRDELLKFHDKYYSSNVMGLSVLGKESLQQLSDLVVPLFSDVKNKDLVIREWLESPFGPDEVKKLIYVVPVKDVRNLNVTWSVPDLQPYYKSHPGHYLGHLIGHEGPGSLLSELKARGWVNTLMGGEKGGARGFMFFSVNVDLTEEGSEHIDDIVALIFQYLKLLREAGPQRWIHDECCTLAATQFRFRDTDRPQQAACHTSALLHDYPPRDVLSAGYIIDEYRPDLITMILGHLVPENIRVGVIGQKYAGNTDRVEQWYGTHYSIQDIPPATLQRWREVEHNPNLHLPEVNEFLPSQFELGERDPSAHEGPVSIRNTPLTRLWYCQDNKYLLPKACISMDMISPYAYMDPLSTTLSYMFVTLFQDALNEYAYAAELAGLHYSLQNTIYGLTLTVKGYHDKQHILLQRVMEKVAKFTIDPERFAILKENYVRSLKNFRAEQPYQHSVYYSTLVTSEQMWTKEELLEATDDMSLERVRDFIPVLLSRIYLEMLVYGNVTQQYAQRAADIVEQSLTGAAGTRPLLPSQMRRYREVVIPDGGSFVVQRENEVHKSCALMAYYQTGRQYTRSNMLIELFVQIIQEPCFDMLRTKEQLGYIVFSGVRRASGVQGLRIIVQSDRHPAYLEQRVEAFLHSMQGYVEAMSDEAFTANVTALSSKRLEVPKKLTGQNAKYWSEIISQMYNFNRDKLEAEYLHTLTKQDVLDFYKSLLHCEAASRRKVSVHVVSTAAPDDVIEAVDAPGVKLSPGGNGPAADVTLNGDDVTTPPTPTNIRQAEVVEDVNLFKRNLALYPVAKPYIKLPAPQPVPKL